VLCIYVALSYQLRGLIDLLGGQFANGRGAVLLLLLA
jgi:hypothetical protein